MKLSLDRQRSDKISNETVLQELERVAKIYQGKQFTMKEFEAASGSCKGSTVLRAFGSWENALNAVRIEYKPRRRVEPTISNEELFKEMERIWRTVGQRPSKLEWDSTNPKHSYTTYQKRFGGWLNACSAFIDFTMGRAETSANEPHSNGASSTNTTTVPALKSAAPIRKRDIPLKLRWRIIQRDNFKCTACGRSPVLNPGTILCIDHIVPFSRGGMNEITNLRVLCDQCNLGKGADE